MARDAWELYAEAIEMWGEDAQWLMVAEEACELAAAVCQDRRSGRRPSSSEGVLHELADMYIMLEQARLLVEWDRDVVPFIEEKLERLERRLERARRAREEGANRGGERSGTQGS